jgi:glycosyltransferase involved in cell wall biosynthesis
VSLGGTNRPLAAIHQAVPALSPGDALGRLALEIRDALRDFGLRSDIFAYSAADELAAEALPIADLPGAAANQGVLLHYAIASPATDAVLATAAIRGLLYYNLTPEEFFLDVSRLNYQRVRRARLQLPALASEFEVALAHSEFSRRDLVEAGYPRTAILPAIVSPPAAPPPRNPERALVLGVGRLAPHKRWELALRALAVLRRQRPEARMELLGSGAEMEPYTDALGWLAVQLDAGTEFRGKVSDAMLEDAYARATVLVLPSAHEGFGIPLLEAMIRGVPVVATAHGAIPEVVGDAALLCGDDPLEIAAALETVIDDPRLRAVLIERGHRRAAQMGPDLLRCRLREELTSWGLP